MSDANHTSDQAEIIAIESAFDDAIARNDPDAMALFMHEDWVLIGPTGKVTDRARFLSVVESGQVVHDGLTSTDFRVRIYGSAAIITSEARSSGTFGGQPFSTHERATSFYIRGADPSGGGEAWKCVLTQLSPIPEE